MNKLSNKIKFIIGIESTCDNTGLCIMKYDFKNPQILYSKNINQDDLLIRNRGIIPQHSANKHIQSFELISTNLNNDEIIKNIIKKYKIEKEDFLIACALGPGLEPCILNGVGFATGLKTSLNCSIISINHITGHILSPRLEFNNNIKFPFINLVISGGHCLLVKVVSVNEFYLLNETLDIAPGNFLDKLAKEMNLIIPNGESIEKESNFGKLIDCSISFGKKNLFNFTFTGLFTQFKKIINSNKYSKPDLCFTIQHYLCEYLIKKVNQSISHFQNIETFTLSGGVSRNRVIFNAFKENFKNQNIDIKSAYKYSCDNPENICWTAIEMLNALNDEDLNEFIINKSAEKKVFSTLPKNYFKKIN